MTFSKNTIAICILILPIIGVIAPRAFSFIAAMLGLITTIEYLINYKKLPSIDWKIFTFISAFIVLAGSSYFWSINSEDTIKRVVKLSMVIIPSLFLLFAIQSKEFPKIPLLEYTPYVFILSAILLLIETYSNYPLYRFFRGIDNSTIIAPASINWSIVILSSLIWPVLYGLWTVEKRNYIMIAITLIITCVAVFSATSQSAMVALLLGSITLILAMIKPRLLLYAIGSATIIGIMASPWIAQLLFNNPPEILVNWTNASAAQRIELWDFVARRALEQPWYGWGIEATRNIHDFDSAKVFYQTTNIIHPHNFAIQLWIELGVLGALTGAGFIFLTIKQILKFDNKSLPFLTAYLVVALIINLVGYGLWQSWLIGLQFTIIAILLIIVKQRGCKNECLVHT